MSSDFFWTDWINKKINHSKNTKICPIYIKKEKENKNQKNCAFWICYFFCLYKRFCILFLEKSFNIWTAGLTKRIFSFKKQKKWKSEQTPNIHIYTSLQKMCSFQNSQENESTSTKILSQSKVLSKKKYIPFCLKFSKAL